MDAMSEKFPVKLCREIHDPSNPLVFLDVRIGDERGKQWWMIGNDLAGLNLRLLGVCSGTNCDRIASGCGAENG